MIQNNTNVFNKTILCSLCNQIHAVQPNQQIQCPKKKLFLSPKGIVPKLASNKQSPMQSKTPAFLYLWSSILNIIYQEAHSLKQLVDQQSNIGIYGCLSKNFISENGLSGAYLIGQNEETKGVAEYSARNCEHILFLQQCGDKQCSILFNCKQILSISFKSREQIQRFIRNWEKEISDVRGQFLLGYVHKFTMTISIIADSFWVTVNRPIYDIANCYNWKKVGRNPQSESDLEIISYYLRCFYVQQFMKLILKHQQIYFQYFEPKMKMTKSELEEKNKKIRQIGSQRSICKKSKKKYKFELKHYPMSLQRTSSEKFSEIQQKKEEIEKVEEQLQLISELMFA